MDHELGFLGASVLTAPVVQPAPALHLPASLPAACRLAPSSEARHAPGARTGCSAALSLHFLSSKTRPVIASASQRRCDNAAWAACKAVAGVMPPSGGPSSSPGCHPTAV